MIAICPNPYRDDNLDITREIKQLLEADGFEISVCPVFVDEDDSILPKDIKTHKLSELSCDCSLVIVVGGDGTVLAAARQLHSSAIPILGINLGTMGFMAALERDELDRILDVAHGKYRPSRRMKLDVTVVRDGQEICRDKALNDVVLHGYGDCIKLNVFCNGDKITAFSGDGIILSTPTGSTGYSMSAGGPIVEPDAENIIITPICPHVMGSRSFVLGPDREISVKMEKLHGRRAYLSLDGNSVLDLANEDIVLVKRSESCTLMADVGLRSFYEITYEKLR